MVCLAVFLYPGNLLRVLKAFTYPFFESGIVFLFVCVSASTVMFVCLSFYYGHFVDSFSLDKRCVLFFLICAVLCDTSLDIERRHSWPSLCDNDYDDFYFSHNGCRKYMVPFAV